MANNKVYIIKYIIIIYYELGYLIPIRKKVLNRHIFIINIIIDKKKKCKKPCNSCAQVFRVGILETSICRFKSLFKILSIKTYFIFLE